MTPRPVGRDPAPHHAAQGLGMGEGEADVPWCLEAATGRLGAAVHPPACPPAALGHTVRDARPHALIACLDCMPWCRPDGALSQSSDEPEARRHLGHFRHGHGCHDEHGLAAASPVDPVHRQTALGGHPGMR